jgi:L-alanine-DL-glutamate epimerase-like enolase superfamily enzyme
MAAGREVDSYWHVLARIRTKDGIEGFGYVVVLNDSLVRPLALATHELGQHLIGAHVFEYEAAWAKLMRIGARFGPGGMVNFAVSSLDIALWDAAGKAVGQPLYRMLGGYRNRLPAYASDGMWYSLTADELAAQARAHVAQGFAAVKMRAGHEEQPGEEVARVAAVRGAVGPDVRILVDATESWDAPRATRVGQMLQDAGIHWLEDPIDHQDLDGMRRLGQVLTIPIATGEHFYHVTEFARLFRESPPGIAIVDLARIGGITPWRRVSSLALAHNIKVCGHVLPELHVHLLSAIPNGHMVEYVPRSEALLQAMPCLEHGDLVAPERPGIGLDLNMEAVQRCRVQ